MLIVLSVLFGLESRRRLKLSSRHTHQQRALGMLSRRPSRRLGDESRVVLRLFLVGEEEDVPGGHRGCVGSWDERRSVGVSHVRPCYRLRRLRSSTPAQRTCMPFGYSLQAVVVNPRMSDTGRRREEELVYPSSRQVDEVSIRWMIRSERLWGLDRHDRSSSIVCWTSD